MSTDGSPFPTAPKARSLGGATSLVHVRLVLEHTGRELACVPLTRLPVAGDRIVVELAGVTRLLQVQVVAHLSPPKVGGPDGAGLDGVAVVVERRVIQPNVADVVPFLKIVRDSGDDEDATNDPADDPDARGP